MQKIYISCDIEGIMGVCHNRQREMDASFYEWGRRMMTRELNLVVSLLFEQQVSEIVVNDSHSSMVNLRIDDLDPRVTLISGSNKTDSMMQGCDASFDGALFIGYHGRGGLAQAVLSHTYADSMASVTLNGYPAGETTLNAAYAGCYKVPVLLVAGDQSLSAEAQRLGTGTRAVTIKKAISRTAAAMFHPDEVAIRYREAIEAVFKAPARPFELPPPYELVIALREPQMADMVIRIPLTERLSDHTIRIVTEDYLTCFRAFLACMTIASANYLR